MKNKSKHLSILAVISLLVTGCHNDTSNKSDDFSSSDSNIEYILANGAYNYENANIEQKNKIVGALERWAVENRLTGLTLYEDGSYSMFNERVKKGTDTYIPNYGFAVLSHGQITADLDAEMNTSWKRYFHHYETSDPEQINYFNDKGAVVGDLIKLTNLGYFKNTIDKSKNCLKLAPSLSTDSAPTPLDLDPVTNKAKIYKFSVRTGVALKYATLSTNSEISKYNGREVELEDYITLFKLYYTQSYGFPRTTEFFNTIKGAREYYENSGSGFNAEAWKNVGIKGSVENGKSYLTIEFSNPASLTDATYVLSSNYYAPISEDFIKTLGKGNFDAGALKWGQFTRDNLTPIDTYLSTGPYVLEHWDKNEQIVFKKNPFYSIDDEYSIAGVHYQIISEKNNNVDYIFEQFLNGKLDTAPVPKDKYEHYKDDKRVALILGTGTGKLNMNTCSIDRYQELFGENGTIYQTPVSEQWTVEPAMSNKNFTAGLSFAMNREIIAMRNGKTPTANLFASSFVANYLDTALPYNTTLEHAEAVSSLQKDTVYGYSLEKAKNAFVNASKELIAEGKYHEGDTIELEVAWQKQEQIDDIHSLLKEMWESAFNTSDNPLRLNVVSWIGENWSDVFFEKLMKGKYDLGFGSISGGAYHHYELFDDMTSYNRGGFTLNWGADTSLVDGTIRFDGKIWSFDALLEAIDYGVYVTEGKIGKLFEAFNDGVSMQSDGSLLVKFHTKEVKLDDKTWVRPDSLCLYATLINGDSYSNYGEQEVKLYKDDGTLADNVAHDKENNSYTVIISKDIMDAWKNKYQLDRIFYQGITLYYTKSLLNKVTDNNYWNLYEGLFE